MDKEDAIKLNKETHARLMAAEQAGKDRAKASVSDIRAKQGNSEVFDGMGNKICVYDSEGGIVAMYDAPEDLQQIYIPRKRQPGDILGEVIVTCLGICIVTATIKFVTWMFF